MKVRLVIFLGAMCVFLCGCQKSPEQNVVSSKNDGTFDANIIQSATDTREDSQMLRSSEQFTSTDGSIEFVMNLDEVTTVSAMPVVEVEPHYLTGEDVKHVAEALFGDAVFYEREPSANPQFSKEQINKSIGRWSQYITSDAMRGLYSDDTADPSSDIDYLKSYIELFTQRYESAPDKNPHIRCDWTFKKERNYNNSGIEINGRNLSDDLDVIYANTEIGDIEYVLTAATREESDYQVNKIRVALGSGIGPLFIDQSIYQAMLCRTEEPTKEQMVAIAERALGVLNRIDMGNWEIAEEYVQTTYYGNTPEYKIVVNAVPKFSGVSAVCGQQVENLTDDDTYVSNYAISTSSFEFSVNGDLINFQMVSPINVKEIVNSNVATLPLESLLEKAKSYLMLSDAKAGYGLPPGLVDMYEETFGEKVICKVNLCELEYGLGRVRAANSDANYYYVPVFVCKGIADYYGKDSGLLYVSSRDYYSSAQAFVWINAVDGTIIM